MKQKKGKRIINEAFKVSGLVHGSLGSRGRYPSLCAEEERKKEKGTLLVRRVKIVII